MERKIMNAPEGMFLTNGQTYGTQVFLGSGDSPDNWWPITREEALHSMEGEVKNHEEDLY